MHPDRNDCYRYLIEYDTPKHVIGHCKGVAAVAYKLGEALNLSGGTNAVVFADVLMKKTTNEEGRLAYVQENANSNLSESLDGSSKLEKSRLLDLDLILAAGLLHDMARVKDEHWAVCADWCHDKGFFDEEKIIRVHMHYLFANNTDHLTEADLVCLADRITLEDHYAGIDKRMEYIVRKMEKSGFADAEHIMESKKEETRKILNGIEAKVGKSIDELMIDLDYDNIENALI